MPAKRRCVQFVSEPGPWPRPPLTILAEGDDCAICGPWPPALRAGMRTAITAVPLRQPICEQCLVAWWGNVRPPSA